MQLVIEKLINDFERGGLTRRQLATALAALVAGAAQAAPKDEGLKAVTLNHVTVRVPDVRKTSQFYQEFFGMPLKQHSENTHILGVGKSFFGIEQEGTPAGLDHYDLLACRDLLVAAGEQEESRHRPKLSCASWQVGLSAQSW
jgi:hypothetical protein